MINVLIDIYIVTIMICIIALVLLKTRKVIAIKEEIKIKNLIVILLASVIPVLNIIITFTALEYVLLSKKRIYIKNK